MLKKSCLQSSRISARLLKSLASFTLLVLARPKLLTRLSMCSASSFQGLTNNQYHSPSRLLNKIISTIAKASIPKIPRYASTLLGATYPMLLAYPSVWKL